MINKAKIHFNNFETFNSYKISYDSENTSYTVGLNDKTVFQGEPDIPWRAVCYIKDTKQIWTHGQIYSQPTKISDLDNDLCITIPKSEYKDYIGISETDENYNKIIFIEDGSGIINKGQLFINNPYWIKLVDELPEVQEADTLYMIKE